MFKFLASLITGPLFNSAVDAYRAKLDAGNNKDRIVADLAARELQVQQAEIEAQKQLRLATVGKWYAPENLFAYPLVFYFGKIYVWDAALHLGTTDVVRGDAAVWAATIVMFLFGKRGVENVTGMITSIFKK